MYYAGDCKKVSDLIRVRPQRALKHWLGSWEPVCVRPHSSVLVGQAKGSLDFAETTTESAAGGATDGELEPKRLHAPQVQ
jgi:hypothetical protein